MSTHLILALLAGAGMGLATVDVLNPQWDPVQTLASHYVHGQAGALTALSLAALGAASTLLTATAKPYPRSGRWLLGIFSAAVLVAAAVPADPPGQWDRPPTVTGTVHGVAGVLAFLVLPAAAVVLARRRGPAGPAWVRSATGLVLVTEVAYWVTFADVVDGPSLAVAGHPTVVGAAERALLLATLLWLATLTAQVRCERMAP